MKVRLSKALNEGIAGFFENHPPQQFSIFLRNLVLEYIREHIRTGFGFDLDFHKHLWSLEDLFELLDIAGEEIRKQQKAHESFHIETDKGIQKRYKAKTVSRRKK